MKYLLAALFLAAAPSARAQSAGDQCVSGKCPGAGEPGKTAAELELAVRQRPADAELHIRLGFAYARLEKADEAQKAFENAVRLDPKKAIAHYMLGLIYEKKGLREKAVAAWTACLENAADPHMRETALKHLHHLR